MASVCYDKKNSFCFFLYLRKEFQLTAFETENFKIYDIALSMNFDKLRHTTS